LYNEWNLQVRGPLVFTLHPAENMTVVKNYSAGPHADLPGRPMAVDWEIDGTDSPWNYAVDTSAPPSFNPAPSAGWSSALPFSTNDYPFSIEVAAKRLPLTGERHCLHRFLWESLRVPLDFGGILL
jgi:hypothetical protein